MKKIIVYIYYYFIQFITFLLPNHRIFNCLRGFLLSPCFKNAGKNIQIGRGVIINGIWNIEIGDRSYIAHYCYVNGVGGLKIGHNTIIAPMCIVSTTNHIFDENGVTEKAKIMRTEIGWGTYIAGHCVINAGVVIGNKVKIGGNSTVIKNVSDGLFVSGVPAMEVIKGDCIKKN